jgi:hypothetical protein
VLSTHNSEAVETVSWAACVQRQYAGTLSAQCVITANAYCTYRQCRLISETVRLHAE